MFKVHFVKKSSGYFSTINEQENNRVCEKHVYEKE